jgi:hypothetical protein
LVASKFIAGGKMEEEQLYERWEKVEQIAFNLYLQYQGRLPPEVESFLKVVGFELDVKDTQNYSLLAN